MVIFGICITLILNMVLKYFSGAKYKNMSLCIKIWPYREILYVEKKLEHVQLDAVCRTQFP